MTSIEWLLSELEKVNYKSTEAMIMYANRLHKQEMKDAFTEGEFNIHNSKRDEGFKYETSEQYYQETFLSNESDDTLKDYHIVDTNEMVELPKQDVDKFEKFLDNEIELGLSPKDTIERIKWYYKTYYKQPKKD